MVSRNHMKECDEGMKLYLHAEVLAQRLSAFYEKANPEYLQVKVEGFGDRLMLRAKPGSEFMAAANENKLKLWEKSEFAEYDQKMVLSQVRGKIREIRFMGKSFKKWSDFVKFLEDPDIVEEKYRSTVEFPKSVEVAMRLKAYEEGKNIKQLVIDALKAYL